MPAVEFDFFATIANAASSSLEKNLVRLPHAANPSDFEKKKETKERETLKPPSWPIYDVENRA